ncbi:MAG: GTPase HflX, partial [Nitrosopumilaceae archaeon]
MKSAILITYDKEDSIREAVALCETAFYKPVQIIKHRFLKRPKFGISEEMVKELEKTISKSKPDVIVYDEILKPSQNYNLASRLKINVLDREALILEIFDGRAASSEAHLQVKLAQLRYEMSRAKEKVRLAKMGEQPGFMGIGQFEVDVYYNDIKNRMNTVKSKLAKAGKQRELHRQSRKRLGFKTISLAGYTSAGKTTLFNLLTGESKEESKSLFTTLSTTTRKIMINKKPVLISDTVGFISKLPAYMIEAFKSTLEELTYTDVVLVIIDVSDTLFELKKKFNSCISTLNSLGVDRDKIIFVLNKSDLIPPKEIITKTEELQLGETKKCIAISSVTGQNITQLEELIERLLEKPVS